MIPSDTSRQNLVRFIAACGKSYIECKQVSSRLDQLLQDEIKKIHRKKLLSRNFSRGRARREAYLSAEYQRFVQHLLEMRDRAVRSKVDLECAQMLVEARKSYRRFC